MATIVPMRTDVWAHMTLYEPHRKGPAGRRAAAGIDHMLATVTGGLKKSAAAVELTGVLSQQRWWRSLEKKPRGNPRNLPHR